MDDVQSTEINEQVSEVQPEVVEQGTPEVAVEPEVTAQPETNEEVSTKDPEWYKKRIERFTKQKYEKEAEIELLKSKLKKYEGTVAAPVAPVPTNFINDDGVIDNVAYQKSMSEYMDSYSQWKSTQSEYKDYEVQLQQREQERFQIYAEQLNGLREKYPDIDMVVSKPVFGEALKAAILESEDSAELAYYLGKNEAEAYKLNQMPPYKMVEQLGRLEEKLAFLEKKSSKAVEPITPLGGNNGTFKKASKDMTDSEWYENYRKEKELKLKKRG